jgi:diketogulonate reductase-like aldo/keto reductase
MTYQTVQGEDVPALGLGTWQITGEDCYEAVRDALEIGYRHIDTAQVYENEDDVGRALADAGVDRDDVFLVTKVWPSNLAPENLPRSVERSLDKLQTDYVDLLYVHWPSGDFEMNGTMEALRAQQDEDRAHRLGVSNFTPDLLEAALDRAPLFALQVEYHPFLDQRELIGMCRRHDLLFTSYSPLARGAVLESDLLDTLAEAHGKHPAQVALRWQVQQDHVAAIPKASSEEHRRSNFDLFDFELSPEEMDAIFELARGERVVAPDSLAPAAWG